MKLVSRIALAAALTLGGAGAASAMQQAQAPAPAEMKLELSKAERAALAPLSTAVTASDWAGAAAALPAAQAAAQGADAKYAVAYLQLKTAEATGNVAMRLAAHEALVQSGKLPAEQLPLLYANIAALAAQTGDRNRAEQATTKWVELAPNDPNALIELARMRRDAKQGPAALDLIGRAIEARRASGAAVPEAWYANAVKLAFDSRAAPQAIKYTQEWVSAFPTQKNWRDTLLIYRELGQLDKVAELDLLRLMRAAKALNGERDYYQFADELNATGLPGEAKAVVDEGIATKMLDPQKASTKQVLASASGRLAEDKASLPGLAAKAASAANGVPARNAADAYLGYGDYAKAAPLYRTALAKGGIDANVVNTRLGMALALSGQRAEAEAAFRAVTGSRATLASYWLLWLAQRA